MRGDPGEVPMFLEDSLDSHIGECLFQVVGARDGEPRHRHICDPGEWRDIKVLGHQQRQDPEHFRTRSVKANAHMVLVEEYSA